MVTFTQVKNNLSDVTQEQMNKCFKVWNFNTGEDYYQVESSDGTETHEVHWSSDHGYTCTCRSGKVGFSNVTVHPSGVCWHVRASVARHLEEEAYTQAMQEKLAKHQAVIMSSIEAGLPAWLKRAKPAPHMKYAPKEY